MKAELASDWGIGLGVMRLGSLSMLFYLSAAYLLASYFIHFPFLFKEGKSTLKDYIMGKHNRPALSAKP